MEMKSSLAEFAPDPKKALMMGGVGRFFMIIGIILIGVFFVASIVLSAWSADYWSFDKQTRDEAKVNESVSNSLADDVEPVNLWRSIEILRAWSGGTQFLGMGLLLFGIGLQLASILGILAGQAKYMSEELGPELKGQRKSA